MITGDNIRTAKSIAEQSQVKVPSFMGYVVYYSLPILGPLFAGIWFLFFR
ncbi:MAG: sodium:proton antiporter [Desulfomonilia bacterium]